MSTSTPSNQASQQSYGAQQSGTRTQGYRVDQDDGQDRPWIEREFRETKPSLKTTEFWISLVAIAGILVACYADSDSFSRSDGWMYVSFVVVAYLISRGLAKAGSDDRYDHERSNRSDFR